MVVSIEKGLQLQMPAYPMQILELQPFILALPDLSEAQKPRSIWFTSMLVEIFSLYHPM